MRLYREDYALMERDAALPGLRTVLDPGAFAEALQPYLPVTKAEARYVRYKPGMNCLVAYHIESGGQAHAVYAKVHRPGDEAKVRKAQTRTGVPGTTGFGRLVLGGGVVVSAFPNDGRLRALRRLGEDAARKRLLTRLFPDHPAWGEGTLRQLNYKPERRYVARLDVGGAAVAVLKFFTGSSYEASRIKAGAFREEGALRLAPCPGHSTRHRILAFGWMPGRLMSPLILEGRLADGEAATAGAALARMHAQQGHGLALRSRDREAGVLKAVAEGVGYVYPAMARRAATLAGRLISALAARPLVPVPVHGDFYAKQVLLNDDGTATVIDFDGSVRGDAAVDAGNFVAHLERDRLRYGLSEGEMHRVQAALLDGYRTAGGGVPDGAVDLYAAVGMLLLAPHPFRFREPVWPARTEALLARAEARLADAEAAVRRASSPAPARTGAPAPRGLAGDEGLAFAAAALDPVVMQDRIAAGWQEWGERGRPMVRGIRLLRHKPGRRCLIAYDLDVDGAPRSLLGKIRARGLDETTFRLMRRLFDEGFGSDSPDGISVPAPVGCLPDLHMWLQCRVPGAVATTLMPGPDGPALARRMAEALHKLHRCGPRPARLHTLADECTILRDRLARVARQRPDWKPRLDRILAACLNLAATLPPPLLRPIHRDFYADNVVVDGDRLFLLDFDLYCLGDPALDAGNFIGHLTEQGLRCTGDPAAMADQEAALIEAFVARAGRGARTSVCACTTFTLARHIYISTRFPERRAVTEGLMALCEERLFGSSHRDGRAFLRVRQS